MIRGQHCTGHLPILQPWSEKRLFAMVVNAETHSCSSVVNKWPGVHSHRSDIYIKLFPAPKIEGMLQKRRQKEHIYNTDTAYWVFFSVACMYRCLGLTTLNWIACPGTVPGENRFVLSHWSPVGLHLGKGLCKNSPTTLPCQLELSLCRSCLGNHTVEISWALVVEYFFFYYAKVCCICLTM